MIKVKIHPQEESRPMAEPEISNPTASWNVTVNGKRVDLLSHPHHKGFAMFDAPALRAASLSELA